MVLTTSQIVYPLCALLSKLLYLFWWLITDVYFLHLCLSWHALVDGVTDLCYSCTSSLLAPPLTEVGILGRCRMLWPSGLLPVPPWW